MKEKANQNVKLEQYKQDLAFLTDYRDDLAKRAKTDESWKEPVAVCNEMIQTIKRRMLRELNGEGQDR